MRARGRHGLLAAASVGLMLVVGSPASAVTTNQSYPVPAGGALTVTGRGFGHGHGMSQYGAEGAARQGLTAAQILAFYYPGTVAAQATGRIRVLIGADTTPDLQVSPRTGLTVRDLGDGADYLLPTLDGVTRWRLNVNAAGGTVIGYRTTRWHRWNPPGRTSLLGDGEFFASGPLTLWTPSGSAVYRGILRAASPSPGSADRDTVNVLSLDKYVQGVVPAEMPASWQTAALRAQAIAARTYAAFSRAAYPDRYYQICDSNACQAYRGVNGEDPRANAAVAATEGRILTYQGSPAFTQFGSSDGGWTAAGSQAYLPARSDPYDAFAGNPVHRWSTTIDADTLLQDYPGLGTLRRLRVVERDGHGQWHGRVEQMILVGTKKDVTISGDTFRSIYGLRSTWFTIKPVS